MTESLTSEISTVLRDKYLFSNIPSSFADMEDDFLMNIYLRLVTVYDISNEIIQTGIEESLALNEKKQIVLKHIQCCLRPLDFIHLVPKPKCLLDKNKAPRILLCLHDAITRKHNRELAQKVRMVIKRENILNQNKKRKLCKASSVQKLCNEGSAEALVHTEAEAALRSKLLTQEQWINSIKCNYVTQDTFKAPVGVCSEFVIPIGRQIPRTPMKPMKTERQFTVLHHPSLPPSPVASNADYSDKEVTYKEISSPVKLKGNCDTNQPVLVSPAVSGSGNYNPYMSLHIITPPTEFRNNQTPTNDVINTVPSGPVLEKTLDHDLPPKSVNVSSAATNFSEESPGFSNVTTDETELDTTERTAVGSGTSCQNSFEEAAADKGNTFCVIQAPYEFKDFPKYNNPNNNDGCLIKDDSEHRLSDIAPIRFTDDAVNKYLHNESIADERRETYVIEKPKVGRKTYVVQQPLKGRETYVICNKEKEHPHSNASCITERISIDSALNTLDDDTYQERDTIVELVEEDKKLVIQKVNGSSIVAWKKELGKKTFIKKMALSHDVTMTSITEIRKSKIAQQNIPKGRELFNTPPSGETSFMALAANLDNTLTHNQSKNDLFIQIYLSEKNFEHLKNRSRVSMESPSEINQVIENEDVRVHSDPNEDCVEYDDSLSIFPVRNKMKPELDEGESMCKVKDENEEVIYNNQCIEDEFTDSRERESEDFVKIDENIHSGDHTEKGASHRCKNMKKEVVEAKSAKVLVEESVVMPQKGRARIKQTEAEKLECDTGAVRESVMQEESQRSRLRKKRIEIEKSGNVLLMEPVVQIASQKSRTRKKKTAEEKCETDVLTEAILRRVSQRSRLRDKEIEMDENVHFMEPLIKDVSLKNMARSAEREGETNALMEPVTRGVEQKGRLKKKELERKESETNTLMEPETKGVEQKGRLKKKEIERKESETNTLMEPETRGVEQKGRLKKKELERKESETNTLMEPETKGVEQKGRLKKKESETNTLMGPETSGEQKGRLKKKEIERTESETNTLMEPETSGEQKGRLKKKEIETNTLMGPETSGEQKGRLKKKEIERTESETNTLMEPETSGEQKGRLKKKESETNTLMEPETSGEQKGRLKKKEIERKESATNTLMEPETSGEQKGRLKKKEIERKESETNTLMEPETRGLEQKCRLKKKEIERKESETNTLMEPETRGVEQKGRLKKKEIERKESETNTLMEPETRGVEQKGRLKKKEIERKESETNTLMEPETRGVEQKGRLKKESETNTLMEPETRVIEQKGRLKKKEIEREESETKPLIEPVTRGVEQKGRLKKKEIEREESETNTLMECVMEVKSQKIKSRKKGRQTEGCENELIIASAINDASQKSRSRDHMTAIEEVNENELKGPVMNGSSLSRSMARKINCDTEGNVVFYKRDRASTIKSANKGIRKLPECSNIEPGVENLHYNTTSSATLNPVQKIESTKRHLGIPNSSSGLNLQEAAGSNCRINIPRQVSGGVKKNIRKVAEKLEPVSDDGTEANTEGALLAVNKIATLKTASTINYLRLGSKNVTAASDKISLRRKLSSRNAECTNVSENSEKSSKTKRKVIQKVSKSGNKENMLLQASETVSNLQLTKNSSALSVLQNHNSRPSRRCKILAAAAIAEAMNESLC